MTRLTISAVPEQFSDSDKKAQHRYEVEFIFGTATCRVVDLRNNLCHDVPLEQPVTETNLREEFERVCGAMVEAGIVHKEDGILCTTFPAGSQRVESRGTA